MPQATPLAVLAGLYVNDRYRRGDFSTGTVPCVRWHLRSFCRFAGNITPALITAALVDAWLCSEELARSTVRHRLSWFRGWCHWLIRHGHMVDDPTRDLRAPRQPRPTVRSLRADDVGRLVDGLVDTRLRLMVLLMAQEGLRACEVARAEVGDVDFSERTLLVRGKGGDGRLLPITDQTWSALSVYVDRRTTTGPLVRGRYRPSEALSAQYVSLLVCQAMRAAGVAGTGHALRHSMAAHVLRSGRGDVRDVQMALGHASLATTSIYLPHSDVERLRHVMAGRWYGERVA